MKQNIQNGTYVTIRIHNLQNSIEAYKTCNHIYIYNDKMWNQKNMKERDKPNSHISSKLRMIYISSNNACIIVVCIFTLRCWSYRMIPITLVALPRLLPSIGHILTPLCAAPPALEGFLCVFCIGPSKRALTLWRRNYFFFNFSTSCIQNVNNTGTKQLSIMKQTALWREKNGEYRACLKYSVPTFVE